MSQATALPKSWRFFLGLDQPEPAGNWFSAALEPPARPERLWQRYPLFTNHDGQPRSLARMLFDALNLLEEQGMPARIIATHRFHFLKAAAEGEASFMRDKVFARFADSLDLSPAGHEELDAEWALLSPNLPEQGHLLFADHALPLQLYGECLHAHRNQHHKPWLDKLKDLTTRLETLLRVEDEKHAPDAHKLQAGLGPSGAFFNTDTMADVLAQSKTAKPMPGERRKRIEQCLTILGKALDDPVNDYLLLHRESFPCPPIMGSTQETRDGFESAAAVFLERADWCSQVFRAVRTSRLELADAYLPHRHDLTLARFDWRDADASERCRLPQITVVERAAFLQGEQLGRLISLVSTGLPVRIIIIEDLAGAVETLKAGVNIGALARACWQTTVVQTSAARPEHLMHGFQTIMQAQGPAVMVVAVPPEPCDTPLLFLEAALAARMTPLYTDDPTRGGHMADRFDLTANPEVTEALAGRPAVTPADVLSLLPEARHHFLVAEGPLPENTADVSLAVAEKLPTIAGCLEDDTPVAVYLDRQLADYCAVLSQNWCLMQEQAGIHNPYAERATQQAHAEAQETLSRQEASWRSQMEAIRDEAGREAMSRLARSLLDLDTEHLLTPETPISNRAPVQAGHQTEPEPPPEPESKLPPEPEAEPEDAVFVEEAYIDTPMCTSCDECINLNSLMFAYNGDGQAMIKDVTAGSFEQLVTAAEACPAHIIHPGAPLEGDVSATPEVLARAAALP